MKDVLVVLLVTGPGLVLGGLLSIAIAPDFSVVCILGGVALCAAAAWLSAWHRGRL